MGKQTRQKSAPGASLLSPTEVRAVLETFSENRTTEHVSLHEAVGACLARDVRVDRDVPPFDRSALDGYAICLPADGDSSADVLDERRFEVMGQLAAGTASRKRLRPGQAMQIMTGAPCPPGSDGVVMVERSRREGTDIFLSGPFDRKKNPGIARRGEDSLRGSIALTKGTRIGSQQISILAGVGCVPVPIFQRASVDVWVTGDEVVSPEARPQAAQIRNSNGPTLLAMLQRAEVTRAIRSRQVKDSRAALRRAILRSSGDTLVFTGGVSMGVYDLVPPMLREAGFRILIHGVGMRPGKPFLFGVRGSGKNRQFAFGLPGNPISSFVSAWEFLVPFLRCRVGVREECCPPSRTGLLEKSLERKPKLTHFVLGKFKMDSNGCASVWPVDSHGSGDYLALGKSNCLILVQGGGVRHEKGTEVIFHPIEGDLR